MTIATTNRWAHCSFISVATSSDGVGGGRSPEPRQVNVSRWIQTLLNQTHMDKSLT